MSLTTKEVSERLIDYIEGKKKWDEIVSTSNGTEYSYSIEKNGELILYCGKGDITRFLCKNTLDSINEPGVNPPKSIKTRKLEAIRFFTNGGGIS